MSDAINDYLENSQRFHENGGTEVYYDQQFLASPRKKVWDSISEYPSQLFSEQDIVNETRQQRELSEKPRRVLKVTVTTEVIEVFE